MSVFIYARVENFYGKSVFLVITRHTKKQNDYTRIKNWQIYIRSDNSLALNDWSIFHYSSFCDSLLSRKMLENSYARLLDSTNIFNH